jgi:hypothetical protein
MIVHNIVLRIKRQSLIKALRLYGIFTEQHVNFFKQRADSIYRFIDAVDGWDIDFYLRELIQMKDLSKELKEIMVQPTAERDQRLQEKLENLASIIPEKIDHRPSEYDPDYWNLEAYWEEDNPVYLVVRETIQRLRSQSL